MSGSRAKAQRREGRLLEGIALVHDRFHKGQVDEAHEMLHELMGSGVLESQTPPLTGTEMSKFDAEFRSLCVRRGVRASFVALEITEPGKARVVTGGHAEVDKIVCNALKQEPPPPPVSHP